MTLTPPTKQEIAKTIYDWFIVNKNPRSAFSESHGACWYRGENPNQRCAVGCCLPDALYHKDFERKNFQGVIELSHFVKDYFSQPQVFDMLKHCQLWHDNSKTFGNVASLKNIFSFYGIDMLDMPLMHSE